MGWLLDKNRPICPQLCEQLCAQIATGKLLPQQRLKSVRDLALDAGVNPNTVQKAFEEMERQGVLHSVRGAGWYVSDDIAAARELYKTLVERTMQEFFQKMETLGIDPAETKNRIKEWNL